MPARDPDLALIAEVSALRTKTYVQATLVVAVVAVVAIVILAIVRPDNTSTGTIILGILLPIISAFLAAAVGQLGTAVNGRLSQSFLEIRSASKREGRLEGMLGATALTQPGGRRASDPPLAKTLVEEIPIP